MQQGEELLNVLETRFEKNMNRHQGLAWADIQTRLNAHPEKLRSLGEMERTGGEPDVGNRTTQQGAFVVCSRFKQKNLQLSHCRQP